MESPSFIVMSRSDEKRLSVTYRLDNGFSKNAVSPPNTINAKAPDCSHRYEEELLAAHARNDVEQTPEDIQHDLDIMNDDSKWNK